MATFVKGGSGGKNKLLELYKTSSDVDRDTFKSGQTICEEDINLSKYNELILMWAYNNDGSFTYQSIPVKDLAFYNDTKVFQTGDRYLMLNVTGNHLKIYNGGSSSFYCYPDQVTTPIGINTRGTRFFLV